MIRIFSILAALAIFTLGSSAISAPKAEFDKTIADFGKMSTGEEKKAVFTLKNVGDEPLEITKVFSVCDCTKIVKSSYPKIAPGKSEPIEIVFDSTGLTGRLMKRILVKTNDPEQERLMLTVQADVLPLATLEPSNVNFGAIEPGSKYETTIKLTPRKDKPFKILKTEPGVYSSVIKSVRTKDKDGSYSLVIQVKAGDNEARVVDEIKITTDLPGHPSITLRIYGNIIKGASKDVP